MVAYSNKVVVFGGTDEYVTMGNVLSFEYNQAFSTSCWFKTTAATTGHLITKRNIAPGYQGRQFYISGTGVLYVSLINDWAAGNRLQVHTATAGWNDGNWHHVVVTHDTSGTAAGCKVYIDNVLQTLVVDYDTLSATILSTASLTVGGAVDGSYLVGRLDEVAIYGKALSATEVTWTYNGGAPRDLYASGSPSGLVAWWRMGEGDLASSLILLDSGPSAAPNMVRDISGNSYHGTMTNMESSDVVYDAPGVPQSVLFGGTDEYVTMGDVLGFEYTSAFSISCWFKTTTANSEYLVSKRDGTASLVGYGLLIKGNMIGLLEWDLCNIYNALPGLGNQMVVRTVSTGWNNGVWHHVLVTNDGTGTVAGTAIYIDGSLQSLSTFADTLTATIINTASFNISGRTDGASSVLTGNLDEVAVYSKEISGSEVTWIYNNGTPRSLSDGGAPSNLAAWWRMGDGDTYPTLLDQTASNYDGTMTNMEATDLVGDSPGHWGFDKKSLLFDGVDEYVTLGNVLSYERTQAFSVSFWVKYTGAGSVITRLDAATVGWMVDVVANGLEFGLISSFPGSCIYGGLYRAGMNDGQWHHCVVSYNGLSLGAGVLGYFDGGAAVSLSPGFYDTLTSSILNTAEVWLGGRYTTGGHNYLAGGIDEVAIYNRVLTLAEVQWIYNAGVPNSLKDPLAPSNLVAYWRMGENAFPGTMTNMEAADIVSESPAGLDGSLYAFIALYGSETVGSVRDGNAYLLGGGGGPTVITHYKLRARDTGLVPPAAYREWESTDYTSSPPPPASVGFWVEKTILAVWTT